MIFLIVLGVSFAIWLLTLIPRLVAGVTLRATGLGEVGPDGYVHLKPREPDQPGPWQVPGWRQLPSGGYRYFNGRDWEGPVKTLPPVAKTYG